MAYLRWGRDSDWYVFWESSPARAKADERLAIWNADVRDRQFAATYGEIQAMLESGDFSSIPGYEARDRDVIRHALAAFIEDVDLSYAKARLL
jgi:hypothetical protein